MKTSTKTKIKKMLSIAGLCFGLSNLLNAQCSAGYTYSAGANGQINFTNTSIGGSANIAYQWQFGDGYTSNSTSPTHTYIYNGSFNATMYMWDSTGNCFDSASQVINITNASTCNTIVNFTYTIGANGQVNFTNTSTNMPPVGPQYYWSFGDGNQSYQESPSNTFMYNGTYSVYFQVTDSTGYCSQSITQTITITNGLANSSCDASFTYTVNANGQVSFTSNYVGNSPPANFFWDFGDYFNTSYQKNPTYTYSANGAYTVTLHVQDSLANCNSSSTQVIAISNYTGTPNCPCSFADSILTGGTVHFYSTDSGGSYILNYAYDFGDGTTAQADMNGNISHTYYYNGTYVVTKYTNELFYACQTSSSTQTITITNAQGPPACTSDFTYSFNSGGDVQFISSYTGNANYYWDFGNGQNSQLDNPSYQYLYNGTYVVTLTVSDSLAGCNSSTSHAVTITNASNLPCTPSLTFVMHQDSLNPQPGVWEISPYYTNVDSAVWSWGDGISTSGMYPTHTYTAAGQYNICVMVYSSCGDSSFVCQNDSLYRTANINNMIQVTVVNNSTSGIKAGSVQTSKVSVYPNPSMGVFIVNLDGINANNAQLLITNILGETVYSSTEILSSGTLNKEINVQDIINGAYFVKVLVGSKMYSAKLIINK